MTFCKKIMVRERIISQIPIERLHDEEGEIEAVRGRVVSKPELEAILRECPVEFYVADVGFPLKRIPVERCYDFWKSEVKAHVTLAPEAGFCLDDFPGDYAYVASEWVGERNTLIILLEKHH